MESTGCTGGACAPRYDWDVTLLTTDKYLPARPGDWYWEQIHREEGLVADELAALGLRVTRADWSSPQLDLARTRCAVFRSTWDYFDRAAEFARWLPIAADRTQLINDHDTITWNMDKHYLADLRERGVEIVPTLFVHRGETADLAAIARREGWEEIIVKPTVSGAARLTFRAAGGQIAALQRTFDDCVAREDMMIQRFVPEILSQGEMSLMVIGGRYTHSIRKVAKAGDFRVQDDHGGTVHECEPTARQIAFAEAAVAACPRAPVYARVDIVAPSGGCQLMELELIEPELFFRFHPPAAGVMARAIAGALSSSRG